MMCVEPPPFEKLFMNIILRSNFLTHSQFRFNTIEFCNESESRNSVTKRKGIQRPKHPCYSSLRVQCTSKGNFKSLEHSINLGVVVFWVAAPSNMLDGSQCFGSRAASIFTVEIHGQGDVSTAFLPPHRGS